MSQDLSYYGQTSSSSANNDPVKNKPNRNSGVFTVLRWLTRGGSASELFFREGTNTGSSTTEKRRSRFLSQSSSSSSSTSWCSGNDIDEDFIGVNGSNSDRSSVDTEASFAYYAPARRNISPGKIGIEDENRARSLPSTGNRRSEEKILAESAEPRRTSSGENLSKKSVGRVHVRGKRKAPNPPGIEKSASTNSANQNSTRVNSAGSSSGKENYNFPERSNSAEPKSTKNNNPTSNSSAELNKNTSNQTSSSNSAPKSAKSSSNRNSVGSISMRRKKRMAPRPPSTALELLVRAQQQVANSQQPDLVLCNDTLRLERGYLMHVNEKNQEIKPAESKNNEKIIPIELQKSQSQTQMAPRPWYKRSVMQAVGRSSEKAENQQPTRQEKRKSCNVSYLANISELDRQTAEILGRDTLRAKFLKKSIKTHSGSPPSAPAFMVPKEKDVDGTWKNSTRRHRSARELIAKFNAITRSRNVESRLQNKRYDFEKVDPLSAHSASSAPNSPNPGVTISIMERSAPSSPMVERVPKFPENPSKGMDKRSPWSCPRCRLQNEYWRIICRVCSAIKPYFDDFTKENSGNQVPQNDGELPLSPMVTQNEFSFFGKQIFENLSNSQAQNQKKCSTNGYEEIGGPSEVQKTDFGMDISKNFGRQQKPEKSKSENSTPQPETSNARFQFFNNSASSNSNQDAPKSPFLRNKNPKVEKMILGDELNVKKPTQPSAEMDPKSSDPPNKQIMEKISFGDVLTSLEANQNTLNDETTQQEELRKMEREKLKKMLIEMKNSLSKRSVNKIRENNGNRVSIVPEEYTVEEPEEKEEKTPKAPKSPAVYVITNENTYENIKVRKENADQNRPVKISSSSQTSAGGPSVKEMDTSEAEAIIRAIFDRNSSKNGTNAESSSSNTENSAGNVEITPKASSAKNCSINSNSKTSTDRSQDENSAFKFFGIDFPKSRPAEDLISSNLISAGTPAKVPNQIRHIDSKETNVSPMVGKSSSFVPVDLDYANAAAEVVAVGLGDTQSADLLMRRLESAITGGRVTEAAELAQKLASLRLPCAVVTKHQEAVSKKSPEKSIDTSSKITVLVHVESRTGEAGAPIRLQLTPKWTLAELRKTVEKDYGVPSDTQRWILGDKLANEDSATLESYGVTKNETQIFLYLIQGQKLKKQDDRDKRGQDEPGTSGLKGPSKPEIQSVKIDVKNVPFTSSSKGAPLPVKTEALTPISTTKVSTAPEIVKMVPKSPLVQTVTQLISPGVILSTNTPGTSGIISNNSKINSAEKSAAECKPVNSTKPLVTIGNWNPEQRPKVITHSITVEGQFQGPVKSKIFENKSSNVPQEEEKNRLPKIQIAPLERQKSILGEAPKSSAPELSPEKAPKGSNFGQVQKQVQNAPQKPQSSKTTQEPLLPINSPLVAQVLVQNAPLGEASGTKMVPELEPDTWYCGTCTLINKKTSLLCEACGNFRPKGVVPRPRTNKNTSGKTPQNSANVPKATYEQLVKLDGDLDLVPTSESFECLICLIRCSANEGCILRECLHQFCKNCLGEHVRLCDNAQVPCPYRDQEYTCRENLLDREVRALVTPQDYERHLRRSLVAAEAVLGKDARTYHCRTADCAGFCTYDDDVNTWLCGACGRLNCLTCRAQHAGENCQTYQARVRLEAESGSANDEESRRTRDWLENALSTGEAIECPTCRTVLMKKWGCDWIRCSVCRTEICWVTRGPRWGPAGKGDTSAGCRCGVNGKKCHPNCNYCH